MSYITFLFSLIILNILNNSGIIIEDCLFYFHLNQKESNYLNIDLFNLIFIIACTAFKVLLYPGKIGKWNNIICFYMCHPILK